MCPAARRAFCFASHLSQRLRHLPAHPQRRERRTPVGLAIGLMLGKSRPSQLYREAALRGVAVQCL